MNKLPYTLTKEEKSAILKLKKLAQNWPESLWLFSNGTLHVMKKDSDGNEAHLPNGGVDPAYIVWSTRDILSEGGDW